LRILKEHIPEIKKIWKAKFGSTYDEGLRFLIDSEKVASKDLDTLLVQIESGKPLQQIIGKWSFYNGEYFLNSNVLIPRPETELIIEKIRASQSNLKRILDLGTGSGCIAIELSKIFPQAEVLGIDKSVSALATAKKNNYQTKNKVKFFQSDWFASVNGKFDLIVSNPPYVSKSHQKEPDLLFEPKQALFSRDNGLKDIFKIISESKEYLNPKGFLFLEHSPEQVCSIKDALEIAQFKNIQYGLDLNGMARYTYAKR
tara:strand:+ start:103 stop:873 length:771 start_codon:yes stop_codon:yes gene_type:complete